MNVKEWLVSNGAVPDLVAFGEQFPTLSGLWDALAADAHCDSRYPHDIMRATWLAWMATRPGVMSEASQISMANQILNGLRSKDGISVMRVLTSTLQAGIDAAEGAALDVIEQGEDTPAMKTIKLAARVASWPSKPADRPNSHAWAWWTIGRSIAAMGCPIND